MLDRKVAHAPGVPHRHSCRCLALLLLLAATNAPPSPYIAKGACPFECCTYRRWQALKATPVLDAPNGRQIARLQPEEWVTALTGETHSIPVPIILRGQRVYVLHYVGEGTWKIWTRGRVVEEELGNLAPAHEPKTQWWAQIRTAAGLTGWVRADKNNFDNQDSCA